MFRFTIRDLLWITAVAAIGSLLLAQRQQYVSQIGELKKQVQEPKIIGVGDLYPPPGLRRVILDFPRHGKGSIKIRYEPIPPDPVYPDN